MEQALDYIYPTAAIVFAHMGWGRMRIMRRFATSQDIWNECATSGNGDPREKRSMLELLEDATGIELQLASMHGKSFHQVIFLDHTLWDWNRQLTPMQLVAMRQQQGEWMEAQVLAGLLLAMHRDEEWGAERVQRFITEYDSIRQELGSKTKPYYRKMEEETEVRATDLLGIRQRDGFAKWKKER